MEDTQQWSTAIQNSRAALQADKIADITAIDDPTAKHLLGNQSLVNTKTIMRSSTADSLSQLDDMDTLYASKITDLIEDYNRVVQLPELSSQQRSQLVSPLAFIVPLIKAMKPMKLLSTALTASTVAQTGYSVVKAIYPTETNAIKHTIQKAQTPKTSKLFDIATKFPTSWQTLIPQRYFAPYVTPRTITGAAQCKKLSQSWMIWLSSPATWYNTLTFTRSATSKR